VKSKKKSASGRDAAPRRPIGAARRPYQTVQKKSRIGVLIADDHSVVREGLASLIQT